LRCKDLALSRTAPFGACRWPDLAGPREALAGERFLSSAHEQGFIGVGSDVAMLPVA
jgi:hypothetical protein